MSTIALLELDENPQTSFWSFRHDAKIGLHRPRDEQKIPSANEH